MEAANYFDVKERIYSWIPRRVEAPALTPTMSREFWMPDRSCHYCFECESHFNLFNRRHHCRLCGRVFCGKCSLNTIAASVVEEGAPSEEAERVRVCNYCYKLRVTEQNSPLSTELHTLTRSSPAQSVTSSVLEGVPSNVLLSPQQTVSGGSPCTRPPYLWDEAIHDSSEEMHRMRAHEGGSKVLGSKSPVARDQPSSPYSFGNRSDDDDDESERQTEGDGDLKVSEPDSEYESGTEQVEEAEDPRESERKSESSIFSSQSSAGHNPSSDDGGESVRKGETSDGKMFTEGMEENAEDDAFLYDYEVSGKKSPPVDYERNPLIWIPPPAADDQDDGNEDDDGGSSDDEEGSGWPTVPRSPGSAGSMDIAKKERSASNEHKKAMHAQVAGHFGNLVAQLLLEKGIDVGEPGSPENWLDIVSALSWQAAGLVKPDTSNGGGMDPTGYVKVKCIATGRPNDSVVVNGIVCQKNVTHKRMTARYNKPRLLLLGGALEYQRVATQLSSLDTLIQQERDHLSMTVARIEALHPNVLLVEKTVSRFAQDIILSKEISLVLNVKRPVLERIARCVGGQIVASPDKLVPDKPLVDCELFHVEKFVEEHGSAGGGKQTSKFLMFFEGCRKPLGCTILLKGANGDLLKKVKEVVQLAVFSAYHLQLETSFLEDEGATLPALPCRPPMNVPLLDKYSNYDKSTSSVPGLAISVPRPLRASGGQPSSLSVSPLPSRTNSFGTSTALSLQDNSSTATNSVPFSASSSCVSSPSNSPGTSPAQSSFGFQSGVSRSSSIGGTSTTTYHHISNGIYPGGQSWQGVSGLSVSLKRGPPDGNLDGEVTPEGGSSGGGDGSLAFEVKALEVNTVSGPSSTSNSDQIVTTTASMVSKGTIRERGDDYHIVPEEVQAHLRVLIQNNWQSEMQLSKEDFPPSPSDRESILVQYTKRCLSKGTMVKGPCFLRIQYYGNADKPLGMVLRHTLFDTAPPCEVCDEPGDAHVHCYTHRQGSLTISVKRLNPEATLSGEKEKEGRIWMWHRCLRCPPVNGVPPATPRVIMSKAAWGLSFGKFLELSFSTHPAATRLAACGHSLHRDCLRFYGFGRMVACFRYAQITLRTVYLPPLRVDFNCPKQKDWLQKEVDEVAGQANLVFVEVVNRLRVLGIKIASSRALYGNSTALDAKRRIVALETLLQNEKVSFEEQLAKAAPTSHVPGQPFADILELNGLRRELFIRSALWDWRLEYLALKCLPTRRRGTGSIDDPSILSGAEINIGSDTKLLGSPEVERDSSSRDAVSSDVESTSGSAVGSSPVEQTFLEDELADMHLSNSEQQGAGGDVNNNQDPLGPTELADGNGLDFRLEADDLSPGVVKLLDNIDLSPKKGHISGSKSDVPDTTLPLRDSSSPLERNGEEGSSTEGSNPKDSTALQELDAEVTKTISSRFLEGDITARRALSEGNFPLLADLSDTLDAAWTGDGGCVDLPTVDASEEKPIDSLQMKVQQHDPESEELVQELVSMVQPAVEVGAQDGDPASQDKGSNTDAQGSAPTSPVKADSNVEDLTEGWMGAPFASFFKSYSRNNSMLSTTSEVKVPPPGLTSVIPRAAQLAAGGGGGARVLLPLGHDDVVVGVYDDEPTTMIAYALSTEEHYVHVTDILVEKEKEKEKEKVKEKDQERDSDHPSPEQTSHHPLQRNDTFSEVNGAVKEHNSSSESLVPKGGVAGIENPLLSTKASQMLKKTISFSDEKVNFQVTCYFAKQFDALRKRCGMGSTEYIRSLCRCKKWGAQGGKSKVFFAKTADDRFVVKQVTRTELTSFLDFASSYFKYLFEALTTGNPTCLAKIFGVYEVKTTKGGKETKMDVLVMENLLYGRHITRLYDLKGSVRSRYNADTEKNQVLLDQNLVEAMPTNPIFVGNKAKRLLERAIWNDTHFLSGVLVMDYSLLVGVDDVRQELVVGIIDFIRQYTWDKHLETWVKASGILGGSKNAPPTVISPKQYKKRFRKAMSTYFLMVPDQWIPPPQLTVPQVVVDTVEDNSINFVMKGKDLPEDPDTPRHISSRH